MARSRSFTSPSLLFSPSFTSSPPQSSSLSVHTHAERILVFLPDCVWLIYLCVCTCVCVAAFAHVCIHVCIWLYELCSSGWGCYNLWLQIVCWVNRLFRRLQLYNECIWMGSACLFVGKWKQGELTWQCGVFQGTWSAADTAWKKNGWKICGWMVKVSYFVGENTR